MSRKHSEREKWFFQRIGSTVFRNSFCNCAACQKIMENGLVIADEQHADYVASFEAESHIEGTPVKYFDTKDEVNEWLKSQSPTE
jgi:hypothetical protein